MAGSSKAVDRNAVVLRAQELRRSPTFSETLLWRVLRKRPQGLKFRRQHPLGWYIADLLPRGRPRRRSGRTEPFDGDRPQRDARRDAWLKSQGLRVLRFDAADVVNDLESVVTAITFACRR